MHCIVLHLYIYTALLEVHTNQMRFQCERSERRENVLIAIQLSAYLHVGPKARYRLLPKP